MEPKAIPALTTPRTAGPGTTGSVNKRPSMSLLKWGVIFFLISLVAALFGFTELSAATADIARILFYIFLVIFLVLLILGLGVFRGRYAAARNLGVPAFLREPGKAKSASRAVSFRSRRALRSPRF